MSAPSKFKTTSQLEAEAEGAFAEAASTFEPRKPGKVYTFYSYKGGVGRSMALANIATLAASKGRRVLIVDWDLEAPGLEHYFLKHDTGLADRMTRSMGVIDLLTPDTVGELADWRECVTQIKMGDVQLDFMQSGKRTLSPEAYRRQVQGLDWQSLYDDHDIGGRFDQIRQEWLKEYDFVFLDSRTGVTDIGDLCTVVLPDHLVLMFVTNTQNVQGIKDIYKRAQIAHDQLPTDRMPLTALPLLSRDEFYSEHAQSSKWRRDAAGELAEIYEAWLPENVRPHEAIQKLFVPYYAIWSFGEALPVMDDPDAIDNPASINAAFSRVSHLILNDLNWQSLDRLSDPDSGGRAIQAQAALEERQAELEAEYKAREAKTRQATGIGLLAIVALIVGIGYWLYNSAVDTANEQARLAEQAAAAAKLEAERQIEQAKATESRLTQLQTSVDQQIASLEQNLGRKNQECLQFANERDQARSQLATATTVTRALQGSADQACIDPLQAIISVVSQDPGNAQIRHYLRILSERENCFFVRAQTLGVQSASVEVFFNETESRSVLSLNDDFIGNFGYEPQIAARGVSPAQCELIDFFDQRSDPSFQNGPSVQIRKDVISPSENLRAEINGTFDYEEAVTISVLVVDSQGNVTIPGLLVDPKTMQTFVDVPLFIEGSALVIAVTWPRGDAPVLDLTQSASLTELLRLLRESPQLRYGVGYAVVAEK